MKKFVKYTVAILLALIMSGMTVYAGPQFTSVDDFSYILPPEVKKSTAHENSVLRGEFFASAELTITNEKGEIGVTALTFMNVPVDELYMTVYLDKWIEKEKRWSQVTFYDFEFFGENYPDGLTSETVEFIIDNQPKGNYYRLRGTFVAIKDGAMEGFGPVTDGILIE